MSGYPYRLSVKEYGRFAQQWFNSKNQIYTEYFDEKLLTKDERDLINKRGKPDTVSINPFKRNADQRVWAYISDNTVYLFDNNGVYISKDDMMPEDIKEIRKSVGLPEYSPIKISLVEPKTSTDNVYEDRVIKVVFQLQENNVSFNLQNKTDKVIKCVWDESSFIDLNGNSCKIVHQGVRYIARNESMPPTIIPPGASISDFVIPTENVTWNDHDWVCEPLFPGIPKSYFGKMFGVFLSLKIDNADKRYMFKFKVL